MKIFIVFLTIFLCACKPSVKPLYDLQVGDIVYSKLGVKGVVSQLTHCEGGMQCWWTISWAPNMNQESYSTNAKLKAVLAHPSTWAKVISND